MDTSILWQLLGQVDAGLKMEVAGQKLKMANHSLHVWNLRSKAVNAPVVLGMTELSVKVLLAPFV
eukprot:Gb_38134 [translate_table: standard]